MQIGEAVEVVEVRDVKEVNTKLRQDWKLLAVVPGTTTGIGGSYVIYVLGKAKH